MRSAKDLFRMASEVVREGCLAINKPRGLSSAQVIRDCQEAFSATAVFKPVISAELAKLKNNGGTRIKPQRLRQAQKLKIGHGGTLDPLATGVLILGIGSGTKDLSQFLGCVKTYETVVLFGASTDTYDRVGRILTKRSYEHITREKVEEALDSFRGWQNQVPPLYSALKMNGKPLYEYAREGKPIPREIASREVEVKQMNLVEWYEPGEHPHRWPTEEAEAAERSLAEQVWNVKKAQETGKKLTPEEKVEEDEAVAAHENFKREFEQRQDSLIRDAPSKRRQNGREPPMMSGALGQMPEAKKGGERRKGDVDIPEVSADTPPPWTDKGPAACKIRMTVSSGYYVRSFCHDLGMKLGSAGLMAELDRIRQSDFTVGGVNCLEYTDLAKGEAVWGPKVLNMLARWNGEPSEDLPIVDGEAKKASKVDQRSSPKPAHTSEKRKSPPTRTSASPPRKVQVRRNSVTNKEEDEKSWNGIED